MAGTSVGGGSLALSIPSSTSTKRKSGPLSSYLSILVSSMSSWASVSHRTAPSDLWSNASATDETMRSKRCRGVMQRDAGMTAWRRRLGSWSVKLRRSEVVMAVLPVASTPWSVRLRHGAAEGWERSALLLQREDEGGLRVTYVEQRSESSDLLFPAGKRLQDGREDDFVRQPEE